MVNDCGTEPDSREPGDKDEIAGTGFNTPLTVKGSKFEFGTPAPGLLTVMGNVPEARSSLAGGVAVKVPTSTNVVASVSPLKLTTEAGTKLEPVSLKVKSGLPTLAELGEIEIKVGAEYAPSVQDPDAVESGSVRTGSIASAEYFAAIVVAGLLANSVETMVVPQGAQ
jgi:hypothetical protein